MRRRLAPLALALTLGLIVTSCGSDDPTDETTSDTVEQAPTEDDTEPTDAEETPTKDDTEPTDVEETEDVSPAAVAAPGDTFNFGEAANTEFQIGEGGEDYFTTGFLSITVTGIEKGDPSIFDKFENAADFEGLVPWYVRATYEITAITGQPNSFTPPAIGARTEAGGDATTAFGWSGVDEVCGGTAFSSPYEVGNTAEQCTVVVAPEGVAVTEVYYQGTRTKYEYGPVADNPYYADPIVWSAG